MKYCWLDCETTGLNPVKNGLVSLAYIIDDEDGNILLKKNLKIQPFMTDEICQEALNVNGFDILDFTGFMTPCNAAFEFINDLIPYITDTERLTLCGYNVNFDYKFVKAFLQKCEEFRIMNNVSNDTIIQIQDLFEWYQLDIYMVTHFLSYCGIPFEDGRNLENVCKKFDVKISPHDAMSDIEATRELGNIYKKAVLRKE